MLSGGRGPRPLAPCSLGLPAFSVWYLQHLADRMSPGCCYCAPLGSRSGSCSGGGKCVSRSLTELCLVRRGPVNCRDTQTLGTLCGDHSSATGGAWRAVLSAPITGWGVVPLFPVVSVWETDVSCHCPADCPAVLPSDCPVAVTSVSPSSLELEGRAVHLPIDQRVERMLFLNLCNFLNIVLHVRSDEHSQLAILSTLLKI